MSRRNDSLIRYALIGGGVYVAYKMAIGGALGKVPQQAASDIKGALGGSPVGAAPSTSSYGNYSAMVAANPNFAMQMNEWQAARRSYGQDPYDWNEFRTHLGRIFAPDPGPLPPREFMARG